MINPNGDGCVDPTAFKTCVDNAFCAWLQLANCPGTYSLNATWVPTNPTDNTICHIKGTQTNDNHEFDDPNTIALNTLHFYNSGPNVGDIITKTGIDINHTKTFTDASTDVDPCPSKDSKCQNNPVDLCIAVTHEICHLFGLLHTTPGPSDSYVDCGSHDPNNQDLMNPFLTQPCGQGPTWHTDDCCMMHKLYCNGQTPVVCPPKYPCANSGVDEGSLIPSFDPELVAYPNPTTGTLTVEYSSDRVGMVAVGIWDILGHQLLTTSFREQAGRDSHTLDLSALPEGHYIVRVVGANLRGSRLVIITHK